MGAADVAPMTFFSFQILIALLIWFDAKMDPQMPPRLSLVPRNFPSLLGLEPFPFITGDGDISFDRKLVRGYPLSGNGYSSVSPLDPSIHPPKRIEEQAPDLVDFQGKGNLRPEFH